MTTALEREAADASDPNTPVARLVEAIHGRSADLVLQNPALALALIEQPDLWAKLHDHGRHAVAGSPHCPESYVAWVQQTDGGLVGQSASPLVALLSNAALPAAARRRVFLGMSARSAFLAVVGMGPYVGLTSPTFRQIAAGFLTAAEVAALDRSDVEPTPAGEFDLLLTLGAYGRGKAVERHDRPTALLDALWGEASWDVRHRLWIRPTCPPSRLAEALLPGAVPEDQHWLRQHAAWKGQLTDAQFREALADDGLRVFAARNPYLPATLVAQCLADPSLHIWLASNPALTEEAQLQLAADERPRVRWALLHGRDASAAVRARVAEMDAR